MSRKIANVLGFLILFWMPWVIFMLFFDNKSSDKPVVVITGKAVSVIVTVEADEKDFPDVLNNLKSEGFAYEKQLLEGRVPGKYYLVGEVEESKIPSLEKIHGVVGVSKNSGVKPSDN